MRHYKIDVGFIHLDSYPGKNDPGALQVEFQLHTFKPDQAENDSSVLTIYGVPWEWIGQSSNLVGAHIEIQGGMAPGLPLATYQSQHYGLLITGQVFKCWGNWIGTDMSIGMSIVSTGEHQTGGVGGDGASSSSDSAPTETPSTQSLRFDRVGPRSIDRRFNRPRIGKQDFGDFGGFGGLIGQSFGLGSSTIGGITESLFGGQGGLVFPLNLIHNMMPNQPLSSAIRETLSRAFPMANLKINISEALKLGYQDAGAYQNLPQIASFWKDLSHSIMGVNGYNGVQTSVIGDEISIYDGTNPGGVTDISVLDLIGQPTWEDIGMVNVMCVLRGDLHAFDRIRLPSNILYAIGPNSDTAMFTSEQRRSLSFNGVMTIVKVTHIGDFRNTDGVQWSTSYECAIDQGGGPTQDVSQQTTQSSQQQNPDQNPPSTPTTQMFSGRRAVRRY